MFHDAFWKEGISSLGQQGKFCQILRPMPICLGSRRLEDIVQKRAIEDRCRRLMLMFQRFCSFGQAVPEASIPVSVMLKDDLRGEVKAWPIEIKPQS